MRMLHAPMNWIAFKDQNISEEIIESLFFRNQRISNRAVHIMADSVANPVYRSNRKVNIPLLLLVAFFVFIDFAIGTVVEIDSDVFAGVIIGMTFSQIVLIAVFTSLTKFQLYNRMIAGTVAASLASLAMFACVQRETGEDALAVALAAAMLVQWLFYQIPLWHIRFKGWCLVSRIQERNPIYTAHETQFGIKQLIIWTSIVAVFLAVFRAIYSGLDVSGSRSGESVTIFLVLSLCNSVLVLPVIWACLSQSRIWMWVCVSVVWCVLLTPLELFWLSQSGIGGVGNAFFVTLNVVQLIAVTLALLFVRYAGFRLSSNMPVHI